MESSPVFLNIVANLLNVGFTLFIAVAILSKKSCKLFNEMPATLTPRKWMMVLAVLAIAAALYVGLRRSTYLPFLGTAAFPQRVLKLDSESEASKKKSIRISVPLPDALSDSVVVYWAASSSEVPYPTPGVAYLNTENVGVTKVKDGMAVFALDCPAEYMVRGSKVNRHVHYRVQTKPGSGLFGPVQTLPVNC